MYKEVAITKQGWDNLSPTQQKRYAKEHPTSMFSRALNLVILKNKAREIRADIKDLKLQLTKRISKVKKLKIEQTLKRKKIRLQDINEDIKSLQKLLEKHKQPSSPKSTKPIKPVIEEVKLVETINPVKIDEKPIETINPAIEELKPVEEPTVNKETLNKKDKSVMDYFNAPLPKESDYLTNRWLKVRKNTAIRLEKSAKLDELREKINSYYPEGATEELKQQYRDLADELDDLNNNKKPSDHTYKRYDDNIKNTEETIRKTRAALFNYLDGVLEGKYNASDYNNVRKRVEDLINSVGLDYTVALVNTNKKYPKYWNHLLKHPEDRSKIVPILTLFDEEQIEDEDDYFNDVENQEKFLRTLSPRVHLAAIKNKKYICQTFKELEDKYIPFKILDIKTTGQKRSFANINRVSLCLEANAFNSVQVGDSSERAKYIQERIELTQKLIEEDKERLDVALTTGKGIETQIQRLKEDEKDLKNLLKKEKYKWYTFCPDSVLVQKALLAHEYGHYIYNIASRKYYDRVWKSIGYTYSEVRNSEVKYLMSEYGISNPKEFFAESFCMYHFGHPLPSHIKLMVDSILELAKDAYPDYGYMFEGITD